MKRDTLIVLAALAVIGAVLILRIARPEPTPDAAANPPAVTEAAPAEGSILKRPGEASGILRRPGEAGGILKRPRETAAGSDGGASQNPTRR